MGGAIASGAGPGVPWIEAFETRSESRTRDRFLGCLVGLAVGDAPGAPYEGLPDDVIFRMGPVGKLIEDPIGVKFKEERA